MTVVSASRHAASSPPGGRFGRTAPRNSALASPSSMASNSTAACLIDLRPRRPASFSRLTLSRSPANARLRAWVTSGSGAEAGNDPLERDAIQRRVLDDEGAEDMDADRHEVGDGIIGLDQFVGAVSEEVERPLGEGVDEQTLLRPEEAVDGASGCARRVGHRPHRKGGRSAFGDQLFGRRPERGPGFFVVLSRPAHG